ncbi:MAG: hypothetical protein HY074_11895 [Deltaproteobacteria bacterium]|nr:hypothetical protein [Deltaproteobacteria bacterium]
MALHKGTIQQKSLFIFLTLTAMTVLVCCGAFWQTRELNLQNAKLVRFYVSTSALRKYTGALKRIAVGSYFMARGSLAKGKMLIDDGKAQAEQSLQEIHNASSEHLEDLRRAELQILKLSAEFQEIAGPATHRSVRDGKKIETKLSAIQ